MDFLTTSLPGITLVQPKVAGDERGFLMETFRASEYASAGIATAFVQENHSRSRRNTLRGLHYQIRHAQGKLVRVVIGRVFDVAVDLRRSSPDFGRWVGIELSAEDRRQMWIPAGFAHGFYVMSESAEVVYKLTDYYAPEWERTLLWNDPRLGIAWPLIDGLPPLLSPRDERGLPLPEAEVFE
jgi:dTDP-4-dehydrorhamnose 3,5-epimerase